MQSRLIARLTAALLGAPAGCAAFYLTATVATAPITGQFTLHPLVILLLAGIVVLAVVACWRWPVVAGSAGVVMAAIIAFGIGQRVSWTTGTARWLDLFDAIGYGAASAYPAMVAACLVAVSALRLWSRRAS
jgi:hypothetical protein